MSESRRYIQASVKAGSLFRNRASLGVEASDESCRRRGNETLIQFEPVQQIEGLIERVIQSLVTSPPTSN